MSIPPAQNPSLPSAAELKPPSNFWLGWPNLSFRYQLYARAYAIATAFRLILPDAFEPEWLPVSLMHWAGAILLFISGSLLGWALCLGAICLELLTLADQLTKTAYLGAISLLGTLFCLAPRRRRAQLLEGHLLPSVGLLTLGVYFLASFHKLNRDFLNPEVSCASGGLLLLAEHYGVSWLEGVRQPGFLPWLFITIEAGLVGLALRRPALALTLAAFMHIPLTIVFAPGFVFVMASGWLCLLSEPELRYLGRSLRKNWRVILLFGGIPASLSLGLPPYDRWSTDPDWCVQEGLLWLACAWLSLAWWQRKRAPLSSPPPESQSLSEKSTQKSLDNTESSAAEATHASVNVTKPRPSSPLFYGEPRFAFPELQQYPSAKLTLSAVGLLWLANGFTPYLGVQFQHTGAMLSNLRVDPGCHNHLFMPEALRLRDETIRLTQVRWRAPVQTSAPDPHGYEQWLYNSETLLKRAEAWCELNPSGVSVSGVYNQQPFHVENACLTPRWPFGEPLFPNARRFQRNLARECPQACIH